MLVSFAYFFFVLSGWFVLRPIREAVAVAAGISKLPYLFAGTLAAVLVANPLFSALVVRYPVRKFIAITYQFFVANILIFYALMTFVAPAEGSAGDVDWPRVLRVDERLQPVRRLDLLGLHGRLVPQRAGQAPLRLHRRGGDAGFGARLGGHRQAGADDRHGEPAADLGGADRACGAVRDAFPARQRASDDRVALREELPIGGSTWAGFTHVLKSPYLLGISAFLILLTLGSTILYFEQADIVGKAYADRAARTAIMARIELVVQSLTLVTQVFFTGRLIRWLGLAASLAFLPFVTMVGFAALGAWPVFLTVATLAVARRAGNFALNNPAMEILFTVVPREDKYKAKNFIETFVYRGGDQIGAWGFAGLTALGLGLSGIAFAAVPIAAVWLVLGLWLGRQQGRMGARPS